MPTCVVEVALVVSGSVDADVVMGGGVVVTVTLTLRVTFPSLFEARQV